MAKITDKIKKIIEENIIAMASADNDGEPRAIAIGDVKVMADDQLLIADIFMEVTKANICDNPRVSLVVWNSEYQGYTLKGRAEYFTSGKYFEAAILAHPGYTVQGAIVISIDDISELKG